MEVARQQMEMSQRLADQAFDRKLKKNEEIRETIAKIHAYKAEKATLKDVLGILKKAIPALADLQVSWSKLTLFFEELGIFIKSTMGKELAKTSEEDAKSD